MGKYEEVKRDERGTGQLGSINGVSMGKYEEVKRDERGTEWETTRVVSMGKCEEVTKRRERNRTTRVVSMGKFEEVKRDERGTGQLG